MKENEIWLKFPVSLRVYSFKLHQVHRMEIHYYNITLISSYLNNFFNKKIYYTIQISTIENKNKQENKNKKRERENKPNLT